MKTETKKKIENIIKMICGVIILILIIFLESDTPVQDSIRSVVGSWFKNIGDGIANFFENIREMITLMFNYPFKLEPLNVILIIFVTVLALASYIMLRKNNTKKDAVESVEFYPPDGLNSLDVGCLYAGECKSEHITSLLLYFQNKGLLNIEEHKRQGTDINTFTIYKLKEYYGNNEVEKNFFEGLFNCRTANLLQTSERTLGINASDTPFISELSQTDITKTVTEDELRLNFYRVYQDVKDAEENAIENELYEKAINEGNRDSLRISGVLALITIALGFTISIGNFATASDEATRIDLMVYSLIATIITLVLALKSKGMKSKGIELYGRVKGFRTFIETAEKDKIEKISAENPEYFFDILPFAYSLGLTNEYISKFENIKVPKKIGSIVSSNWTEEEPCRDELDEKFEMPANEFKNRMNPTMANINYVVGLQKPERNSRYEASMWDMNKTYSRTESDKYRMEAEKRRKNYSPSWKEDDTTTSVLGTLDEEKRNSGGGFSGGGSGGGGGSAW